MKLYYHPFSPNARKPAAVVAHLELPVELVLIDLSKGAHRQPEYLALNPNGKVPTLQDGDFVVWESTAIMQFLCDHFEAGSLYPQDHRARADVNRWLAWQLSHWGPALSTVTFERFFKGTLGFGTPDEALIEKNLKSYATFAAILNTHLSGRDWVAGSGLTIADFAVGVNLTFAAPANIPLDEYPHIQAWYARLSETKGWQATEPRLG